MPLPDYAPVAIVGATALVGYGELRARTAGLRRDVDAKASRDVVETQYAEILRRLDRIEDFASAKRNAHREGD